MPARSASLYHNRLRGSRPEGAPDGSCPPNLSNPRLIVYNLNLEISSAPNRIIAQASAAVLHASPLWTIAIWHGNDASTSVRLARLIIAGNGGISRYGEERNEEDIAKAGRNTETEDEHLVVEYVSVVFTGMSAVHRGRGQTDGEEK